MNFKTAIFLLLSMVGVAMGAEPTLQSFNREDFIVDTNSPPAAVTNVIRVNLRSSQFSHDANGITLIGVGSAIGTGTPGYIPYWLTTNTLGNSPFGVLNTNILSFNSLLPFLFYDSGNLCFGENISTNINTSSTYNNTIIGHSAGHKLISGGQNLLLGSFTGYYMTNAYDNVAAGSGALNNCINGYYNVAAGSSSLLNTLLYRNIGIGWNSGATNTNGVGDIFIGSNSNPLNDGTTDEIVIGDSSVGHGNHTATLGGKYVNDFYVGTNHVFSSGGVGGGNVINTGPSVVNMVPVYTDTSGTQVTPTNSPTFSGAVYSTSPTTNGPSANEFVTADWARRTFAGSGAFFYNSTNVSGTAFDASTFQYVGSYPPEGSRSYTPAAGAYFGSVITTNRYQQVNGPILVQVYLTSSGGASSAQYRVHPEIYYTYDTNSATLLGDYEAADQAIIHGTVTNRYDFAISFPPIISTNANGFWLVRRFKVGTKVGTDTLKLSLGTNGVDLATSTPSSISFTIPAQAGANWVASGSTDSGLTGTATAGSMVATNCLQSLTPANPQTCTFSHALGLTGWLVATGDVNIASSALSAGSRLTLNIDNSQVTNINVVLPATWRYVSGANTNILAASKIGVLTAFSRAANDTNVVSLWSSE